MGTEVDARKRLDGDDDDAEVAALRNELESLYAEILPVAQMSAEQQYLEPALRLTATHGVQGKERSVKTIDFVRISLNYSTARDLQVIDLQMPISARQPAPSLYCSNRRVSESPYGHRDISWPHQSGT